MTGRVVLLDTSFVVALENKDDPHHQRAKQLDDELLRENAELLLHWGILLEIADGYARVGRRVKGHQLLAKFQSEGGYRISSISEALTADIHFRQAGFNSLLLGPTA